MNRSPSRGNRMRRVIVMLGVAVMMFPAATAMAQKSSGKTKQELAAEYKRNSKSERKQQFVAKQKHQPAGRQDEQAAAGQEQQTAGGQVQLPTTLDDFFEPGTQEGTLNQPPVHPFGCRSCHQYDHDGNASELVQPYDNWSMSMMAQSARDPIWRAALAIANQDIADGGDTCIRCHSPNAWLDGRSVPTDASAFTGMDFFGVSCNICHRLVDPVASSENPSEDSAILKALASEGLIPPMPGNARYVVDPNDSRRGPIPYCPSDPECPPDAVPANYHSAPILTSPFHREGALCGTCHDVSNSIYSRQEDGRYTLNAFDSPHPTMNPHDMMPEQRTYSEWLNSTFANGGVFFEDGRFGGDHPTGVMQSCQDCHMPKHYGGLCSFWTEDPFFPRLDVAEHSFIGANTWVIGAVHDEFGSESGLTSNLVALNRERTEKMLRNASDMVVTTSGSKLLVRVINMSGHKLPTGYPEGRRMWLNVKFFNEKGDLVRERGDYDFTTATLRKKGTKVYEAIFGMDNTAAAATGLNSGESFHLTLNNTLILDNRIPPMGFTNEAFEAVRAAPVNYSYADGQYWDDTYYNIPTKAAQAVVTLYYQTTSREYIEFLRDANTTNNEGQNAYDLWVAHGMSAPVDMDVVVVDIGKKLGDINDDGFVNVNDLLLLIGAWGPCAPPALCPEDLNGDGKVNVDDLLILIGNWGK